VEIDAIADLAAENFGPVLHVARFPAGGLGQVIDQINATGYGLTLGLHSRIDSVRRLVESRARVGNLYVNRNQIGAVVGSQPFGGEGLSGTGPKAGGPHYVVRFATERITTIDTTAAGGNATLLAGG
jgi:RHH-type proline utilization regulon transcriptional repressor/proline dehydrogenase/delta 1-pyrroline-5-carboxylate dehydrogenase